MNELALFAGAGGGILGGHLLGWRTICAVEWMPYPRSVLMQRQNDGILRSFPIWDDVQTFDGKPWAGLVDVVSGGFPCQDISAAGKGAGIDGERSGMWHHMARIIREVGPQFVFVENSPILTSRGLGRVLGDLAEMGYDAEWGVLGAVDVGAPHRRDRIWIVAYSSKSRFKDYVGVFGKFSIKECVEWPSGAFSAYRFNEAYSVTDPSLRYSNDYGVAAIMDEFEAIGNGQVPAVAATAFRILSERLIGKEFQTTNKEMEG